MKLQNREYQNRSARDLRRLLKGDKRVVAVGPTGCGKTRIATLLIEAEPRWHALFVVHRYEMADQAYRAFAASGVQVGIVMAQEETLHGEHRVDSLSTAATTRASKRPSTGHARSVATSSSSVSGQLIMRQMQSMNHKWGCPANGWRTCWRTQRVTRSSSRRTLQNR